MPKIQYVSKNFSERTLTTIAQAAEIIREYDAQGYSLTLRQLYYQFVARDLLPNRQREYKRLGNIVSDGRLAGLLDWWAIEDRTRGLASRSHWSDPAEIVEGSAKGFYVDRWANQPVRVEVWIEKEALAGVFDRVCSDLDVPFFSCRGYTSQSEMWRAARRFVRHSKDEGKPTYILHFGDHDPSGIDMTRDIVDRMEVFGARVHVDRLALNMNQVEEWNPPPNPAKVTDSRFDGYLVEYGPSSWELDALEPATLSAIVRDTIEGLRDEEAWAESEEEVEEGRRLLQAAADRWEDVVEFLETS